MPEIKLKQLQYQTETWKKLLGFMSDENINLKNRLTEILKNNFDSSLLEEVENFHNDFVKEDERIRLLKNEVADLDKLLVREIFEDGCIARLLDNKFNKYMDNIKNEEAKFTKLKFDFNNYLSENVTPNR